jgi:hypothetical protein
MLGRCTGFSLNAIFVYFNNTAGDAGVLNALEFKLITESDRGNSSISG